MEIILDSNLKDGQATLKIKDIVKDPYITRTTNAYIYDKVVFADAEYANQQEYYRHHLSYNPINLLKMKSAKVEAVDTPVLCLLERFDHNYSHFIRSCLSGFLLAKSMGALGSGLNLLVSSEHKFQKQFISLLGMDKYNIIQLQPGIIYSFKNFLYSNLCFDHAISSHPIINSLLEAVAGNIKIDKKINLYITRINCRKRQALNEKEVIKYFQEKGFEIADFDNLDVLAQIALINSSQIICAAHGASGANLAFRNKEQFKFIEYFSQSRYNSSHLQLLINKNCEYSGFLNRAVTEDCARDSDLNYYVDMKLLDKCMHSTLYRFEAAPNVNRQTAEAELFSKASAFLKPEDYTLLKIKELDQKGLYKEAFAEFGEYHINKMSHKLLCALFRVAFLSCEIDTFDPINSEMLKNVQTNWRLLLSYNMRMFNLKKCKEIIDQIKPVTQPQLMLPYEENYNYLVNIQSNGVVTWHCTTLSLNSSFSKLVHGKLYNSLIDVSRKDNQVVLSIPAINKYISMISADSSIEMSDAPVPFTAVEHNPWCFSIIINDKYLCATDSGSFTLKQYCREWERLFIRSEPNWS